MSRLVLAIVLAFVVSATINLGYIFALAAAGVTVNPLVALATGAFLGYTLGAFFVRRLCNW